MKNIITLINLSIIFGITAIFTAKKTAEQTNTSDKAEMSSPAPQQSQASLGVSKVSLLSENERPTNYASTSIAGNDLDFITRSVEVCLVKLEEGKIAQQQGNLKGVKEHGTAMVASHNQMLTDLKKIATSKSVITSADMPDNFYALEDLRQLHGESFDKKFVKKMLYNYKRSVRDFERATRSQDADIQVFATKYLPLVKAQYAEVKSLKKKL